MGFSLLGIVFAASFAPTVLCAPINGSDWNPSFNSTTTCQFSDAKAVIDFLEQRLENATSLVAGCTDVCAEVFGSGNPVSISTLLLHSPELTSNRTYLGKA